MSTALVLADVTAMLKEILVERFVEAQVSSFLGGDVTVSALSPDLIKIDTDGKYQLNLFLYQVTPNPAWQNSHLPSRDSQGERTSNPPLALNLHYLITAYGKEDMRAEAILGYAMRFLHESPILTREAIRKIHQKWANDTDPFLKALATSRLSEQAELVKIWPQVMSTEEISKLWSSFQAKYRPTSVYMASVVLIESEYPAKSALPVRERKLHVIPFSPPMIEAVSPQSITAGGTLTLLGRNLKGPRVRISFGKISVVPDSDKILQNRIEVVLPAELKAGINIVQVIHELDFGTPKEPHRGFESNPMAFILRPIVQITNATSSNITLNVNPKIGKDQKVELLLNERSATSPSAYSFVVPISDDASSLTISIHGVKPAEYFVRLRVDGAESPLELDPGNPNFGPKVTIP